MKTLLHKIIQTPVLYAKFLNTLSFLEYIGARKILKSQPQQHLTSEMLAHISEEVRHAQVLKRAALRIAPEHCRTYALEDLLCGQHASDYIQTVDKAVASALLTASSTVDPWVAYLYTTLIIEQRATEFYQLFESVLQASNLSVFRGILQEEEAHLMQVSTHLESMPDYQNIVSQLTQIEAQAFMHFITAVEQTIHEKS
ncbi:MAG: hypothetical protein QM752_01640 [Gammaproteobacteria bacterium]